MQVRTGALCLRQNSFAALTKAAKPFGEDCPIEVRFGGENKPIAVAFGLEPRVRGLVCPMRWDFDKNAPAEPVEP